MIQKPRKPIKPVAPTKTITFEKTAQLLDDFNEIELSEFEQHMEDVMQGVFVEVNGSPIKVRIAYEYGDWPEDGVSNIRLELVYQVEEDNTSYEKDCKSFVKKEAKYNSAIKTYRKAMKQYREDEKKVNAILGAEKV